MMNFLEKYIMPSAVKLGNQRHLIAIRDALVGMISITMVGALLTLINNLGQVPGFGWYGKMMVSIFGANWTELGGDIWWGTLAFMTVFAVFGISYKLAKSYGDEGFEAMMVAGASFFVFIPQIANVTLTVNNKPVTGSAWGFIGVQYFNATALFTGIILSIIATELFVRLSRVKKLEVRLPDGVPPAVARSFQKLFPGMFTVIIIGILGVLFKLASNGMAFNDWLNKVLVTPLGHAVDSLPFALAIVFFVHFFWILGLHGTNILGGITTPLFSQSGIYNIDLYAKHVTDLSQYKVLAGNFLDAYVYLGGAGGTIGLLIAMFIAGRKRYKQLLSLAGPTGIFMINEPVLFGLPIVLNPIWFIPFLLSPLITTIVAYLAVSTHLVFPAVANIPWVTPPIVGGFLVTGGHISGAILAAVNLVISVLIYLPFVYAQVISEKKAAEKANKTVV